MRVRSNSNPSAVHAAVAHLRSRQQEWGRRDLNPRSTDISGSCASELQRVVNAGGDQPPARYISLESRLGRGGLWSQSPCRAWPRPRAHHFPRSLQMDFDTRGRSEPSPPRGRRGESTSSHGPPESTPPQRAGCAVGHLGGVVTRARLLVTRSSRAPGTGTSPLTVPYRSVPAQSQSWHFQPVTSSVTDGM